MSFKSKLFSLTLGAVIYGNWESKQYRIKKKEINLGLTKDKNTSKKTLKILHISDLHFDNPIKKRAAFFEKLSSLNPDLIINTGDNLASQKGIDALKTEMKPIMKFNGAFVYGANDYYNRKYPKNPFSYFWSKKFTLDKQNMPIYDLELFFIHNKWINLNNDKKDTTINGAKIHLEGINDPHANLDNYNNIAKNKNADLNIGLIHSPYKNALRKFSHNDIIFSGHTHGGQIRLPKKGALVSNSDIDPKYASGLFRLKDIIKVKSNAFINISQGLGTSKFFKFRFNCPPTTTLITIK